MLPAPLVVEAIDANEHTISSTAIEFASDNAHSIRTTAIMGADGRASVRVTVRGSGTFDVRATAAITSDSAVPASAAFAISGTASAAAQLLIYGGNNATVAPGTAAHPSLRVPMLSVMGLPVFRFAST